MGAVVCATTSAYGQSKPARARLMINLVSWGGGPRPLGGGVGAVVWATTSGFGQSKPAIALLMLNFQRSPPPPRLYERDYLC